MISWRFPIDRLWTVATVASQTFWEVGSLDLAWWPNLRWPVDKIFRKYAEMIVDKAWKNGELSSKNRRECSPSGVRVIQRLYALSSFFFIRSYAPQYLQAADMKNCTRFAQDPFHELTL